VPVRFYKYVDSGFEAAAQMLPGFRGWTQFVRAN
jgi:hypothetical protein